MTAVLKTATLMPMPVLDTTWDFSPVFNLIQTLSKHDSPVPDGESPKIESRPSLHLNGNLQRQAEPGLGSLNQVWDYLGVQRDVPPPAIAPFERSTATAHEDQDTYASDGALYYPPSAKSVKWRDEEAGQNLTDVQDSPPSQDESTSTRLTKTQRKKLNRKARKAAEQSKQEHRTQQSPADSGDDSEDVMPTPSRTKIGVHQGVAQSENVEPKKVTKWAEKKLEALHPKPAPPQPINYSMQEAASKADESKSVVKQVAAPKPIVKQEPTVKPAVKQEAPAKAGVKQDTPSAPRPITFSVQDAVRAVQEAQNRLPPSSQSPTHIRQKSSHSAALPAVNGSTKDFSKSPAKAGFKGVSNAAPKQSPVNNNNFSKQPVTSNMSTPAITSIAARRGTANKANEPATPIRPGAPTIHHSLQKLPVAKPAGAQSLLTQALLKAPVQKGAVTTTPASQPMKSNLPMASSPAVSTQTPTRRRNNNEIVPLKQQTSVDRNWDLLLKLMNNFPLDRKFLLSPLQLSINRPTPNGIHVFVDASNIMIGFMDALKRARGIPPWQRVTRVDLNFHALALLMERRRPVARRILAGSTPELTAFEEARQVGYETNILDKVYKAKELTERQRRFALQDQERKQGNNGYQSGSDSAGNGLSSAAKAVSGNSVAPTATAALSPAEAMAVAFGTSPVATATLPPQNPKWIEQAVDEILHLKILESVVDTDIPLSAWANPNVPNTAPTMVVATGDAAEAEYSQGFMKMVQRALSKGWNVEVAAWGKSVSQEYRRMESSKVLGERFKIIELDGYAEELFGESIDGKGGSGFV